MSDTEDKAVPEAAGRPTSGEGREEFLNTMIGTLCETIEDVVGVEDAEAFIGIVGRRLGGCARCEFGEAEAASPEVVAQHLADAKNRIGAEFVVKDVDGSKITFANTRCPFRAESTGRASLCKITTNFFGRIAAEATGYARVDVKEALSRGDGRCLITVDLERETNGDGQEFYG